MRRPRAGACRAYPRSHGATGKAFPYPADAGGLSPLARGNRLAHLLIHADDGPIPARTGQPTQTPTRRYMPRAYPRSHGATPRLPTDPVDVMGLSPLARGNLVGEPLHYPAGGPIPARTGQPWAPTPSHGPNTAYPRSHGATSST